MVRPTPEKPVVHPKPIVERHVQTVLLALVVGVMGWSGSNTMKLSDNSARQDERIIHLIALTEQLRQDLRSIDSQYITRREADIHRSDTRSKLEELGERVTRLESTR